MGAGGWKITLPVALVIVVALGSPARAQRTDVVTLANGDRITGEVSTLDRGRLENVSPAWRWRFQRGRTRRMRMRSLRALALMALCVAPAAHVAAQDQQPTTRAGQIEQQQKAKVDRPYQPNAAEKWLDWAEGTLTTGSGPHPFFESAYAGGGFTLGAGYLKYVSPYNTIDVRGSISRRGYKRIEAEFITPQLMGGRGRLSVLGGWRDATQVGFYGIGSATSKDDRVNYSLERPYASTLLTVTPRRTPMFVAVGIEVSQWNTGSAGGSYPSIETVYTPDTLPGLGAQPVYVHTQGTVGIDTRLAPDYARRGGFYGVTFHDYADTGSELGFALVEYEAIQHIPILREAWVISLRGRVQDTSLKEDQQIPYFMLPSLGSGSTLRSYSSWRFRDRNSLLLQAEWRVIVNRALDLGLFYDAGKVTAHTADLSLDGLTSNFGVGVRFHGPMTTPVRVELAKGSEGFNVVFGSSAAF